MIIDSQTKVFEKPPTGVYDAVFADYVDIGMVTGQYGAKHKVRLFWLLNKKDSEGNLLKVMQQVNASMWSGKNPAKCYEIVKSVLGKAPALPFDLENLIGLNNQLVIQTEPGPDGKTYSNVKAILPAKVAFAVPSTFVREKDRVNANTQAQTAAAASTTAASVEVADEDIPF